MVDVPSAPTAPFVKDPAPSVAGTEHQSIVEKMDWRQVLGLYDLVSKQKDEANRGNNMVIDASRFGGSDNVSDLSDNTSREAFEGDNSRSQGRGGPPITTSKRSQTSLHLIGAETERISNIVNISNSLSVGELENLVSYLSQMLQIKCRESETSHIEGGLQTVSEEPSRRPSTCLTGNSSPDSRQTPQELPQSSPYMLSQSAPSSFFTGAVPTGVVASSASHSAKRMSPYRAKEGLSSVVKRSARDDDDDEDEEIKTLSSKNDESDLQGRSSAPAHRRNMSTPSPKLRRSFTTPTKTPPNRSGAIPPVPGYGSSMDSDNGGIMTMSSAPNLTMSAKPTSGASKKRGSQSPIVITGSTPVMSSTVLPVGIRKQTPGAGVYTHAPGGDTAVSIILPNDSQLSGNKKQRPSYDHVSHGHSNDYRASASRHHCISEFHLSPNCAFEDCSVHSGSSASYYTSNSMQ